MEELTPGKLREAVENVKENHPDEAAKLDQVVEDFETLHNGGAIDIECDHCGHVMKVEKETPIKPCDACGEFLGD